MLVQRQERELLWQHHNVCNSDRMKKIFRFVEEKYQEELLRWLTYLGVPTSGLFIVGSMMGDDIGGLLMALGVIASFTAYVVSQLSFNYGGKHILSIGALGGLSFGMIIRYFMSNIFDGSVIDGEYYFLLAIILMGIFSIAFSRKKFSQRDKLIRAGMSMTVTFAFGAFLGVILGILLIFILGGIGLLIGFVSGVVIMVFYFGTKLGEHFNLDENEIYSPREAGIIGAGIGGLLGLGIHQMVTYYYPSFYYINSINISLGSIINIIAGMGAGLFFAYLSQKTKIKIDQNE